MTSLLLLSGGPGTDILHSVQESHRWVNFLFLQALPVNAGILWALQKAARTHFNYRSWSSPPQPGVENTAPALAKGCLGSRCLEEGRVCTPRNAQVKLPSVKSLSGAQGPQEELLARSRDWQEAKRGAGAQPMGGLAAPRGGTGLWMKPRCVSQSPGGV